MIQGDADWFAARAGKFTGPRFSDLMARTKSGPSTSRANLLATLAVERLTGMCVETYTNGAMQRGTELAPFARADCTYPERAASRAAGRATRARCSP